jgi:hypothetical protein
MIVGAEDLTKKGRPIQKRIKKQVGCFGVLIFTMIWPHSAQLISDEYLSLSQTVATILRFVLHQLVWSSFFFFRMNNQLI